MLRDEQPHEYIELFGGPKDGLRLPASDAQPVIVVTFSILEGCLELAVVDDVRKRSIRQAQYVLGDDGKYHYENRN
ncbi:MAG: hypothetical protein NUV34_10380 [Sulfuricaulis sp.]|nr:hypothetical protein [Sulfuricaulis sp.]